MLSYKSLVQRRAFVALLLLYSLATTGLIGSFIWKRGGMEYVSEQLGFTREAHPRADWQEDVIANFALYPVAQSSIVFAGDSITASMPWAEYFSRVKNRGVGAETSSGLLARIKPIASYKPEKLFINIGTNDLSNDISPSEVLANIVDMVDITHKISPRTYVYEISVLPTNPDFQNTSLSKRKLPQIGRLNDMIAAKQEQSRFQFIDVSDRFKNPQGQLKAGLTIDGTHLSARGGQLYAEAVAPYVIGKRSDTVSGN